MGCFPVNLATIKGHVSEAERLNNSVLAYREELMQYIAHGNLVLQSGLWYLGRRGLHRCCMPADE